MKRIKRTFTTLVAITMVLVLFVAVPGATPDANAASEFASKQDLDELMSKVDQLTSKVDQLTSKIEEQVATQNAKNAEQDKAVDEEKATRAQADAELTSKIEEQVATQNAKNAEQDKAVEEEKATRTQADKSLGDRITEIYNELKKLIEDVVAGLKEDIKSITTKIEALIAKDEEQDKRLKALEDAQKEQAKVIEEQSKVIEDQQKQIDQLIEASAEDEKQTSSADIAAFTNTVAKIKTVTGGIRKATVTCETIEGADGYEVSLKSIFMLVMTERTAKSTDTTMQVTSLSGGQHYIVRVRGYKTVDNQKIYTDWSDAKLVYIYK